MTHVEVYSPESPARYLNEFYEIYSESLPEREQKSRDEIERFILRPEYKLYFLVDDGFVVGFSILYFSSENPIVLLEYMAISEEYRNRGLGAGLFTEALNASREKRLLIEVDSDREDAPDKPLRIRRKNFYRRLGARQVLGLDYELPLPGHGAAPLMDIMVHANHDNSAISRGDLASWITDIYVNVYGQLPTDHRINDMVSRLDDPVSIEKSR